MELLSAILENINDGLSNILPVVFTIIQDWWWIPLLVVFFNFWKKQWYFYKAYQWDLATPKILLEIKVPAIVERPIKAMENVFNTLWGLYGPPNWREKWLEGQFPPSFTFEIAGFNQEPHFYIRTEQKAKTLVESTIYSQYPDAEVIEVEDYTKNVPNDIPNKEWNLFGVSMHLQRKDFFPIVTYKRFFEEVVSTPEEKRLDPLSSLMDGIATLKPGEQIWIQICAMPVTISGGDAEVKLEDQAQEYVDKAVKRPGKIKSKSLLQEGVQILATGKPTVAPEVKNLSSPEMDLTPREKDIIRSIEDKISKQCWQCSSRFIYLGTRDVFFKGVSKIPFAFYSAFASPHLNFFMIIKYTFTKIVYFFKKRRLYLRCRKLFRSYKMRVAPSFPEVVKGETFVLNSEELATMFHLPSKDAAPSPTLRRVGAKKSGPPSNLPTQ